MKSLLLTRSKEFNNELKLFLQEKNIAHKYKILELNLLNYQLQHIDFSDIFSKFNHIIITSIFAAQNMPHHLYNKKYIYVVGQKSAKILADKGYIIQNVAKNAPELKKIIDQQNSNIHKEMIYLSGNNITLEMNRNITRKIFYKTNYKESLPKSQILRYKSNIDFILLYSYHSAKIFVQLMEKYNLFPFVQNSTYIVLSDKIMQVIKPYFNNVIISKEPHLILAQNDTDKKYPPNKAAKR